MSLYRCRALFALILLAFAVPTAATAAAFAPTRFSVETVGAGPDVILIPGLSASREVWRGSVTAVPGYRYHLVQVAGFAGAPARGNARGPVVAPLAEEIASYIAAKGLNRPMIVGHSMGGAVAMMIASRHPDRVGKVMVVDMLPQPAGLLGSSADQMSGLADLLQGLAGTVEGRGLIGSAIRMFGSDPAGDSRSDADVVARAAQELARLDLTPDLPKILAPLTIVYASPEAQDNALFDQRYREAYRRAPAARLLRIDRSGHMIMFDQPAAFRAALRRFLAG
jgi:pimeloyl-ACP methyl ester carboxylesterase